MSISPESIKGESSLMKRTYLLTRKENAEEILTDRVNGVVSRLGSFSEATGDNAASHAVLFTMKRDTLSILEDKKVLKKGIMQKIAFKVMSGFGFNENDFILEEESKSHETRTYPSSIHEGLIFRRYIEKDKYENPTCVTWTVHAVPKPVVSPM